jgi:hypothetical protein
MLPFSQCLDMVALYTNIFDSRTRIKTVYFFIGTYFCLSQNFGFCYKVVYVELR